MQNRSSFLDATPLGEVAYVSLPSGRGPPAPEAQAPGLLNLHQTLMLQGLPEAPLPDWDRSAYDGKARTFGFPPGLAPLGEEDTVVTPRQHLGWNPQLAVGHGRNQHQHVAPESGGVSTGRDQIWGPADEFYSRYGGHDVLLEKAFQPGLKPHRASGRTPAKVAKAAEDKASEMASAATKGVFKGPTEPLTTLMVRNIPLSYTNEMLLEEWPNSGQYDLLYLPFNCALDQNLTYAFINFVHPDDALAFMSRWHKSRLSKHTSRKPLNVSYASVQGRTKNLLQLKRKRVWRIKFREGFPLVFENGHRANLEEVLEAAEAEEKLLEVQETCRMVTGAVLEI